MERRALLVGINHYDYIKPDLNWCTGDALSMREMLGFHANHDTNYVCRVLLGSQRPGGKLDERVTFNRLRKALAELFAYDGEVALYFSGHGIHRSKGVYLATQDSMPALPGILVNDLLTMANQSPAREVLLLLDCCYAGALGEPSDSDEATLANMYLREGVTLIAASRAHETALEREQHGVFTRLLLGALESGAADLRGMVSAASLYTYVEQALGPWDQRPVYKSNASRLSPIRYCVPEIDDDDLRRLPLLFPKPDHQYGLNRTYEVTQPSALPAHIEIFNLFKRYQLVRLLRPSLGRNLYDTAMSETPVELTPLGRFYRKLAIDGLLGRTPNAASSRREIMPGQVIPNAESVAKLFHETYERLAPTFGYETQLATRVPWEDVPERNKRLMIAVTAEILAMLFAPVAEPQSPEAPEAQKPDDRPGSTDA
jgi:hypothetical protein